MDPLLPSLPTLLVLRALENGPAHGYRIAHWVDDISDGILTLKEGTLYPLLHQLEKKGLVSGSWEQMGSERPVKVYELTDAGHARLNQERETWDKKSLAVRKLLLNPGGTTHGMV